MDPLSKSIRINSSQLLAIVVKKNVKLTWLAHVTLVDRKTISRWMNGEIKRVRRENFEKLVEALECEPEDLIYGNMTTYASKEDQKAAIDEILSRVVHFKEKHSVEKIIKGLMIPSLPPEILLSLCTALCKFYRSQNRYQDALLYEKYAKCIDQSDDISCKYRMVR